MAMRRKGYIHKERERERERERDVSMNVPVVNLPRDKRERCKWDIINLRPNQHVTLQVRFSEHS